jgi:ABC-type polysaccharide transport system permease subunit
MWLLIKLIKKESAKMNNSAAVRRLPGKDQSFVGRFFAYLKKYWFLYMLILPGFVCMDVFNYGPMYGIQLAFKDYSPRLGVWGSKWIGLDNFYRMFKDPNFIRAF